ncbi:MAG TPA: LysE family translocator, partial [Burkholderiaceae bacterium]|nr:LysE family translocator [Burkholderiaceae bacterium]
TIYIIGRSAAGGLRCGVAAALGIGAGCLFHVAAAVLGLSALLASSTVLFSAMKIAGAGYLAWIALSMLRSAWHRGAAQAPSRRAGHPASAAPDTGAPCQPRVGTLPGPSAFWPVLRQGCLTNMLNPKVALFFLAFLPQFVSRDAAHPALAMAVLGAIFCINGTVWCLLVAWSAARLAHRLNTRTRLGALLEALGGSLLLWLAARLALSDA